MALREPREDAYRLRPAGPFDLDEVARIESESFPVPWKREFFASELVETDAQVRKRGYGRWLLEDAIARARTMGSAAITLEVRVGNAAARQFYRSYAFTEAYRRRAYYQDGEDALVLVLPLRGASSGG